MSPISPARADCSPAAPHFYPQFATHNAHTVAAVLASPATAGIGSFSACTAWARRSTSSYEARSVPHAPGAATRIYAPVGSHEDLLAYLVRRLLENGANTSFVNRIVDDKAPIEEMIADPVTRLARLPVKPHPRIPLPRDLYAPERKNAAGLDLNDPTA